MKKTDICAVIPAFNEEEGLTYFLDNLEKTLKTMGVSFIIAVIDDGSADNTWEVIHSFSKKKPDIFCGIRFSRNFGKDAAIMAVLENIEAESYLIMDSDGQHPAENIREFIRLWKEESSGSYSFTFFSSTINTSPFIISLSESFPSFKFLSIRGRREEE